ncbi:MAG: hypothetical protein IT210_24280 [Armatimonadetes bacterium]|nr:hypothetical protein [Armatimonadota bacterium]
MSYTLHVISHTHWDREWHLTFQQFRMRLVDLMDRLLALLDRDAEFLYFNLDGQTIVLEDYLEIRPEMREKLARYIGEGRILAGPWYELNDEFLTSGEATIRSLLIGHRIARQFGPVMKVGYLPDEFGNISQMPQIFRGFGIDNCIFGRGLQLTPGRKVEFLWESPDGSRVNASLMAFWYNNAQRFPDDPEEALRFTLRTRDRLAPHALSKHLLLMNGCDHLEAQDNLSGILKAVNDRLQGDCLIHSTLPAYAEALRSLKEQTELIRGELREDRGGSVLAGVLSSRMYLKMANERCQTALEGYAEPASAFAWLSGADYPASYLTYAWKMLLQNHPHDSICGCSIDQVHEEMMPRFAQAQQVADSLTDRALTFLAGRTDTSGLPEDGKGAVLLFNPLNVPRHEVADLTLDIPIGPPDRRGIPLAVDLANCGDTPSIRLLDMQGQPVPQQISDTYFVVDRVLNPIELPQARNCRRFHLSAEVDIPPCGYTVLQVAPGQAAASPVGENISRHINMLENEHLTLQIQPNGSFYLLHKETDREFFGLGIFEDVGDAGDEYRHIPPPANETYTTLSLSPSVALVENGPLKAIYKVEYDWPLPKGLSPDLRRRLPEKEKCRIATWIALRKGAKRVEIRTEIENRARDHRIRALFLSQLEAEMSLAEGQFDVVSRPLTPPDDWQGASPFHPQQSWVSADDFEMGLTVINRGLPEYELYPDEARTLALTLLRCVGRLSGEGDAPGDNDTPGAQCLGTYTFHYAIYPHAGTWAEGRSWEEARRFNLPARSVQTGRHPGELPARQSCITLEPSQLVLSAVKKAEDSDDLAIRFFNIAEEPVEGKITVQGAKSLHLANLDEEIEKAVGRGKTARLSVEPKKIVTIIARRP